MRHFASLHRIQSKETNKALKFVGFRVCVFGHVFYTLEIMVGDVDDNYYFSIIITLRKISLRFN